MCADSSQGSNFGDEGDWQEGLVLCHRPIVPEAGREALAAAKEGTDLGAAPHLQVSQHLSATCTAGHVTSCAALTLQCEVCCCFTSIYLISCKTSLVAHATWGCSGKEVDMQNQLSKLTKHRATTINEAHGMFTSVSVVEKHTVRKR